MEYWKEKLNKEAQELKEKLDKLINFISSDKFDKLSNNNKKLLKNQKVAMGLYLSVLNMRLKNNIDYIDVPDLSEKLSHEESR